MKFYITLLLAIAAAMPARGQFNYSDFSSVAGLNLISDAIQSNKELRLTTKTINYNTGDVGAAWYGTKQNVANGFMTRFQFQISDTGNEGYIGENQTTSGDGFAFVIQNDASNCIGSALDYYSIVYPADDPGYDAGIGYSGITSAVAAEFDMYYNTDLGIQTAIISVFIRMALRRIVQAIIVVILALFPLQPG